MTSERTNKMKESDDPPSFIPFKYKYCRLCGYELKQGVLIFGEEGKRLQIPEKIRKTLAILIFEEDTLPKKICTDCCSSLEDYALYKDTVLDAQEKLTSIAKCYPPPTFPSQQFLDIPRVSPHYSEDLKPILNARHVSVASTSSSSTSIHTCRECGKKFRVRSDFENHITSTHPNYNYKLQPHRNLSRSVLPETETRHDDEDVSHPPSPASESSCHLTTVDLELEDERRDSKAGIVLLPVSTAIASSSATANRDENSSISKIPEKSLEKDSKPSLQCTYCDKVLMTKNGMYLHLMTHKGRRFQCEECSSSYAQKSSLTVHIRTRHAKSTSKPDSPGPRFSCPQCPTTFSRKSGLSCHIKGHMESRPFECSFCQKSYKSDKCLKKHLRYHTAADAFSCSLCDKTFCIKSKLEEHENVHTGRRPYGCNFCAKAFTSMPNYLKHVRRKHKSEIGQDGKVPPHIKGSPEKVQPNAPASSTSVVKNPDTQLQPQAEQQSQPRVTPAVATFVQEKNTISVPENGDMSLSYNCPTSSTSMAPPPLSPSPSWVDLTGKQQHQQQQHVQQLSQTQNSDQPLAMNLNMSQTQNNAHHQSSQQQIHHHQQHHNHQPQQQHQNSHVQLNNHYQNHHSNSNNIPSQMSNQNQHQLPQGPSSASSQQHQLQPQGPSSSQHLQSQGLLGSQQHQQQTYQNPNSHTQHQHSHTTPQGPASGHHHIQQPLGHSNHQQQGHSSNNQQQQPSSSQHHQQHQQHVTVSQSQPSSSSHSQQHQQQNSHAHLLQQHHHLQQYQSLGLGFQNPYNHHPQPLSLNSMDLMDCAIQSAVFGSEPHGHNGGVSHSVSAPSSVPVSASTSVGPQNHPMELSYKLDNTSAAGFQEMPMELTKVFQSGPLELCVRNDFNQLVDLTAKEPNFNERMSSIMDFRQQPMDLISRNEVCAGGSALGQSDNNNLVDLSLRSSFQDQSESSFLRDLIDLSSRSDYHGELNLSARAHHINHAHKANSQQNVVYSDSMFGL